MESNKDEAIKATAIAERKISENDYDGAKTFVNKARNLYPKLDGLKKLSMMIDVYISASNKINRKGEADWYGVLGVDPLADDEALKKQYKKLALLLHPDKNKFAGATEVFKLISEAWCFLSDKAKRASYDQTRKSKEVKHKKTGMQREPPKRHKSDFSWKKPKHEPEPEPKAEPEPNFSWKYYEDCSTFWTKCDRCHTHCVYLRNSYLNKTLPCPNCRQDFVATEIVPKLSYQYTFSSGTSASESAKAAEERMRSWFEPDPEPKHEPDSSSAKEEART